jgi:hypothetical protein
MNYIATKPEPAAVLPIERRASPRRKTRFKATVVYGAERSTINCMVRNLSESGACIKLDAPDDMPAQFHLIWLADRTVISAEAVWRSHGEMGVKFVSKHDIQGRLSSELAAVCRAWEQRERVRA